MDAQCAGDRMNMVSGCSLMAECLEKRTRFDSLKSQPNFLGSVCRAAKTAGCKPVTLETPGVRFPPLPLTMQESHAKLATRV